MRQGRWVNWIMALALVAAVGGLSPAAAEVTSDRAAAILHWPLVDVNDDWDDTLIQLSNTSTDPVDVWCFWENSNSHCTNTGQVCLEPSECCDEVSCGVCEPGWNETDFHIRLTPRQPLGWLASAGLSNFPIDGIIRQGSDGSSNAGSRIPPVPEDPFNGLLKCIVVDENGTPIDSNVIKGEATLQWIDNTTDGRIDAADYNAVGLQAIEGAVNDDNELVLGGDGAEYNGCPSVLILDHFFDGATVPVPPVPNVGDLGDIFTDLVLTPCTEDLLRQEPGSAVVQYLVYNEFEQRFSTSNSVECQTVLSISNIDTTQWDRSIFSVGVAGTLTGQTRLSPIGAGLLGVAQEWEDGWVGAFSLDQQGDKADSDTITLP